MKRSTTQLNIEKRLNELLWKYNIPGASLAVLENGEITRSVAGVANIRTRTPVTPDTIFLIGSITKVVTTTLVMQLVDAGMVRLDDPVVTYLPELELTDKDIAQKIKVRDLLRHTNGITGDYLDDFGRGDDAIEKYVRSLSSLPILHQPNDLYSYSNSAFILTGYLIERLTGETWHQALRSRLLDPLGLDSFVTLPEDALRYSVAVAHQRLSNPQGGLQVGEMWREFHAGAPAGFTPYSTPSDLLTFADLHLNGGRTRNGQALVSQDSVSAMQEINVSSVPSGPFDVTGWGLGWILHRYGSERVFGHNGGSSATLRVLPDKNFAIAVLTNASGGVRLAQEIIGEIVGEQFGLSIPDSPEVETSDEVANGGLYEGAYQHLKYGANVTHSNGELILSVGGKGSNAGEDVTLRPIDQQTFVGHFRDRGNAKVSFLCPDADGRPQYLHLGLRAYKRTT